jgi:hypothetical protein
MEHTELTELVDSKSEVHQKHLTSVVTYGFSISTRKPFKIVQTPVLSVFSVVND